MLGMCRGRQEQHSTVMEVYEEDSADAAEHGVGNALFLETAAGTVCCTCSLLMWFGYSLTVCL